MSNNKDWTWDDYDYLYNNYSKCSIAELAEHLGRTPKSVSIHAEKLGLLVNGEFKPKELKQAAQYGSNLGTALVFLIPERSTPAIEELIECAKS